MFNFNIETYFRCYLIFAVVIYKKFNKTIVKPHKHLTKKTTFIKSKETIYE